MAFTSMAIQGALGAANLAGKFIYGMSQKSKANKINPVDPGYQINSGVIDANRAYEDQYANYQMPGKEQLISNMGRSAAQSLDTIERSSTSTADIIAGAAGVNMNQNNALSNLAITEAQKKEGLFDKVMGSRIDAGQEYVKQNEYERDQYEKKLAEKAALSEASTMNKFSAADQATKLISSMMSYKPQSTGSVSVKPQPGQFS